VIHRDLKPSNIMLGPKGMVYLLDFGIARHQESEHTVTRRMGPGTWEYMSPEQFDDEAPSASMDVYGLGATIYYSLTGKHPFDATALRKLILQKDKGCPSVSQLGLSDGLAEGLALSLHPDSGSRPKSCGALIGLMRGIGRKKTDPSAPPPPVGTKPVASKPVASKPVASKPVVPAAQKPEVSAEVKPAAKPAPAPVKTASAGSLVLPAALTNSIGMKFRLIQPGMFMMGSPESETGRYSDERQHQVRLTTPYYLGIYTVTQSEYARIMGSNPSDFKGDRHPVEQVSWEDATAFIQKLNGLPEEKTAGRLYRLPTESEWEYACRSGSSTAYCFGEGDARLGEYAWYDKNSGSKTHPVGQKAPNAWGLYDMHANVWEWCSDWYGDYPSGSVTDPTGASTSYCRVNRGGGWRDGAGHCRSAFRRGNAPSNRLNYLGFRLALSSLGTSQAAERGR
jgi:formylglycine-generating enzyme required for sulfatase activity